MNARFVRTLMGGWGLLLVLVAGIGTGRAQTAAATNQSPANPALAPAPLLESRFAIRAWSSRSDGYAEAVASWRRALQLEPDSPALLNNLAWILASDDRNREGAEAIQLARRACELTQWQDPLTVGTLAAAYAKGGQFSNACATARMAIALAEASHAPDLAARNRQMLKYYEAGMSWHGPSPRRDENVVFGLFLILPFASGGLLHLFARFARRRKPVREWRRLVLGNLLVLVFMLSFLPIAGETYYRFIYDTTDALDFTKVSNRWFVRYWHLNPSGCRDNVDYFLKIKPGQRRITFVGDSFAAGHGIKEVEDRFANRLRRAHPDWEIHLLAQLGYDTGAEQEYLKECLDQGYELDQVVLVYCLNDVSDLYPDWTRTLNDLTMVNNAGWLPRNSCLVNTLYYRLMTALNPDLKNYFQFIRDGYSGPTWEQQKQRLEAFRDLVQSHGGRLRVVTFPFSAPSDRATNINPPTRRWMDSGAT